MTKWSLWDLIFKSVNDKIVNSASSPSLKESQPKREREADFEK